MEVRISYSDGTSETISADLVGYNFQPWVVHLELEREPKSFTGDNITYGINETQGEELSGTVEYVVAETEEELTATWEVVGTYEDVARDKMRKWMAILGDEFKPYADAASLVRDGVITAVKQAKEFDSDQAVWGRYLEADLEYEALLSEQSGPKPGP